LNEPYSGLSAAKHTSTADAQVFEGSRRKIVEHFDARRLFKF
jgi:hypothetical protein